MSSKADLVIYLHEGDICVENEGDGMATTISVDVTSLDGRQCYLDGGRWLIGELLSNQGVRRRAEIDDNTPDTLLVNVGWKDSRKTRQESVQVVAVR